MKNNVVLKNLKQGGWTLIELAIVLTFLAIALGTIALNYSKVTSRNSAKDEIETLQTAINDTRTNKGSSGYPSGTLINPVTNQWGGTITSVQDGTAGFKVTDTKVPNDECTEVVTAITKIASMTQISIGSTVLTSLPVSRMTAETECAKGVSGTGNTLIMNITG